MGENSGMINTVIFDLGGVLLHLQSQDQIRKWLKRLRVDENDPIAHTLLYPSESKIFWDLMRGKLSERQFWLETAKAWRIPNFLVVHGLRQISAPKNMNQPLVNYLTNLRGKFKLGILSNAGDATRAAVLKNNRFDGLVDVMVISAEEGFAKPDREIYEITLRKLGSEPQECVFVDDLQENIQAARALGMTGIQHIENESTIRQLNAVLFGKN